MAEISVCDEENFMLRVVVPPPTTPLRSLAGALAHSLAHEEDLVFSNRFCRRNNIMLRPQTPPTLVRCKEGECRVRILQRKKTDCSLAVGHTTSASKYYSASSDVFYSAQPSSSFLMTELESWRIIKRYVCSCFEVCHPSRASRGPLSLKPKNFSHN